MTHTENLIFRLRNTASRGVSSWGDLQQEAADEIETLMNAVASEREACAKIVEESSLPDTYSQECLPEIANDIRARGQA